MRMLTPDVGVIGQKCPFGHQLGLSCLNRHEHMSVQTFTSTPE
ncbi:hypothetical protein HMPREF9056_01646 [Actinomyces sp. oral taxon 170 str. F0386]|nr:hypothetical protein HMPREF9056_01646 [Actinomyces sp. oral taxon 170 str. F0386]